MPAAGMHSKFATDINNRLNLDLTYLKMFSQGPDTYFYERKTDIGQDMHNKNTKEFLETLLSTIKDSKTPHAYEIYYGMLAHYVLDKNMHPYIFYRTGNRGIDKKYEYMHSYFESLLDDYYAPNMKFKDSLPYKAIDYDMSQYLDSIGFKLYGYPLGERFNSLYKLRRYFSFFFRAGPNFELKYLRYKLKDNPYLHTIESDVLNRMNKMWLDPVTGVEYHKSVNDLYKESLDEFFTFYEKSKAYLKGEITLEEVGLKDVSYYTNTRGNMKYFNF